MQISENIQFSVSLPRWMVTELDQMRQNENRSRNNMVETLLRERLGKKKK